MKFSLSCELGYQVKDQASFVLNIQPSQLPQQRILRG